LRRIVWPVKSWLVEVPVESHRGAALDVAGNGERG